MNHETRVYNDVFEMLPNEENPSPLVRVHRLNPSPEFTLYAKLEWQNPHIWFYLDVKGDDGKTVKWQFEGGPPNALRRNGVSRDNLKEGDLVTVRGILAKKQIDGVMTGDSQSVTFANGKRALTRDATEDSGGK